ERQRVEKAHHGRRRRAHAADEPRLQRIARQLRDRGADRDGNPEHAATSTKPGKGEQEGKLCAAQSAAWVRRGAAASPQRREERGRTRFKLPSSFPRRRESSSNRWYWTPACAGMTSEIRRK